MPGSYYVGFDVHKRTVSYCVKTADGTVHQEGVLPARRPALQAWAEALDAPWQGTLEATMFTPWVYDTLKPLAQTLRVAHPLRLRAITAAKKKNDAADAATLADLLRCNLIPECYMAPPELRDLRRILRYRNRVVSFATRMKNKTAGLLMEAGVEYDAQRLHRRAYFEELLGSLDAVPDSVVDLLKLTRSHLELFSRCQRQLVAGLLAHPDLQARVERLRSIGGVGEITALTWALEIADPHRFSRIKKAVSYCGLCGADHRSGDKVYRSPLSKQRNAHLQTVLIEAAKLAPRHNPPLAAVHARERARGANPNQATLAVARKLVAYLLAVDKTEQPFELNRAQAR